MAVEYQGNHGGNNNGDDADGGRRQASEPQPPPPTRVAAVLPGLANAPREAALEERGFVLDGLAEFWAAAAAAAKVARFCNCRALIPGERSQRGWCQTWAARQWRGWTGTDLSTRSSARRPRSASRYVFLRVSAFVRRLQRVKAAQQLILLISPRCVWRSSCCV